LPRVFVTKSTWTAGTPRKVHNLKLSDKGQKMIIECIFCGEDIEPEPTLVDNNERMEANGYLFQCENPVCGAIYTSIGSEIPIIKVYNRPEKSEGELSF